MTTVFIADDHEIVRNGIRALLETYPEFSVVGEASDGIKTIELVEQTRPDVIVLDVSMPNLNGLEATKIIKQRSPSSKILILSMYNNEAYVQEALRSGADGYAVKDDSLSSIINAISEVAAGKMYLSNTLSERFIHTYVDKYVRKNPTKEKHSSDHLTAREKEILQLVSEGYTSAKIAERLSISPRTAETHRANLMHKLGAKNQAELIRYAIQHGQITDTPN